MSFLGYTAYEAVVLVALTMGWVVFVNGVLLNVLYVVQLVVAYFALRGRRAARTTASAWWRYSEQTVPISLLAPAYNEQETIVESVRSMLALNYPYFEVVVINDGSKDETLARLTEAFALVPIKRAYRQQLPHAPIKAVLGSPRFPKLVVVNKTNGGKADALNAGVDVSASPLVCAMDADSLLESDSLLRAVQPFIENYDKVVACGGSIRVVNGSEIARGRVTRVGLPRDLLSLFQVVEYLRAFLIGRLAWSQMGAMMLISGAFGIFKRQSLVDVGGYSLNTVGEDMEVIVKMHRHLAENGKADEMRFVPEPVCWTEAPRTLSGLAGQRRRWQRGSLETFFRHRSIMGRSRYGLAGTVGYFHILITDVLGPPLEAIGYLLMPFLYAIGLLDFEFFMAYIALTFVFGIFISVGSLVLEELELRRYPKAYYLLVLMLAAIVENFGYRQLNTIWRIQGWWQFVRGRVEWESAARRGFNVKP